MSGVVLLRRSFLLAMGLTGAGLALGGLAHAEPTATAPKKPRAENPFVFLRTDGFVDIVCQRSEMGQGVRSTLPVLIADELGADPKRVRVVQADGDEKYGDQNTDGSHSIRGQFEFLRKAGATARAMLIAVAAARWKVPAASCVAEQHQVKHPKSGRAIDFGELAEAASKLPVPAVAPLRPRSELTHLGKDLPLLDAADIVTGRAVYGADLHLPGMLTAIIARPPVVGGRVKSHDATRALAIPGVRKVITLPAPTPPYVFQPLGGVAVIAEHTYAAMRGRAALQIDWDDGKNADYDSTRYRAQLLEAVRNPGRIERNVGDVDAALAGAHEVLRAEYYTAHLAHATMEPPCAVARFENGRCEVWAPTQNPQAAREWVAKMLGIDQSQVAVHVTLLGGGFGRKSKADFPVEAALLAREMGVPVRVQWTREDDLLHDYYHSVGAQHVSAGLDARGALTAYRHRTAFPPIGSIRTGATIAGAGELQQGLLDLPVFAPNVRIEVGEAPAKTRIGWLRSVHNIRHAFATQSFFDEIAHARGVDPRQNLLEMFGPARIADLRELGLKELANYGQSLQEHPIDVARMRRVLERVTEISGWSSRGSRALGVAVHRSFLAYIAVVISVVKNAAGKLRADEAWICADVGTVVNRERVVSQLEGAVLFGLGQAMFGEITMKNGRVQQPNFRDYRLLRLADVPRAVHVDLIPSEGPPCGVGEPGVPPVAPALGNAIFALTGTRVRELPMCNVVSM